MPVQRRSDSGEIALHPTERWTQEAFWVFASCCRCRSGVRAPRPSDGRQPAAQLSEVGHCAMSIEPIGLLTMIVGLMCVFLGHRATFATLVPAALFGSAAAILIGSANIQPGHLFLAFAALSVLARRHESAFAIAAAKFPQPGFWFMCLMLYGVFGAILIPRLAAGSMDIIPLGTSAFGDTGYTVPLGPVSSNFTQSIYLVADFICFIITLAVATTRAGFLACTGGVLAYAAGNVLFA